MKDTSVSWGKIALVISTALWVVFCQSGILGEVSKEITLVVSVIIAVITVWLNTNLERRLTAWSLSFFGVLFWVGWEWIWTWSKANRHIVWAWGYDFYDWFYNLFGANPSFLLWITCMVLTVSFPYLVWRKLGLRMTRLGWKILGVLILAVLVNIVFFNHLFPWTSFFSVLMLSVLLTFIAIGFPFAKYDGLTSGVFIAAFEPVWLEVFYKPLDVIRAYAHELSSTRLGMALFTLSFLPLVCFWIVVPIGVLRSRSAYREKWLLLPALLTLVGIEIARGIVLIGTYAEYSLMTWLRRSLIPIQLWLPLLLVVEVYTRQSQDACQ